jgi:hypothetical protein
VRATTKWSDCTCNMVYDNCTGQWSHHPSCKVYLRCGSCEVIGCEGKCLERQWTQKDLDEWANKGRDQKLPYLQPTQLPKPEALIGIGGGPTRATTLPSESAARKRYPIATGVLDYFPDALAALSHLSWKGNDQHNPGQPLHWDRSKSADEWDTLMRHFLQRGTLDADGIRHSVKVAWRALAALQKELEAAQKEEAA